MGRGAVIPIAGPVTSSRRPFGMGTTPDTFRRLVEIALRKGVDGFIVEINSPGGEVVPSKEIAHFLRSIGKPSVAIVRGQATSGAYLVAAACDKIVADELSLVGSIGVLGSFLEASQLLEKFGVRYQRLVGGEKKDAGSPFRSPTEEERSYLQKVVNEIHSEILDFVVKSRHLAPEQAERLRDGRVFLAREGKDVGLVDSLGGGPEAVRMLNSLTGARATKLIEMRPKVPFIERLIGYGEALSYRMGAAFAEGFEASLLHDWSPKLR